MNKIVSSKVTFSYVLNYSIAADFIIVLKVLILALCLKRYCVHLEIFQFIKFLFRFYKTMIETSECFLYIF